LIDYGKKSNIKLLLMGKCGAGKTSMHSIIFANLPPSETMNIGFTRDVNENRVKFLGMALSINDCGGQDKLMESYFNSYPDRIFSNVKVLIYVFDVTSMNSESIDQFTKTVDYLIKFSPDAKVFVLVHKMDMVPNKDESFKMARSTIYALPQSQHLLEMFATTIWDVTLYKAWSKIVQTIVPN